MSEHYSEADLLETYYTQPGITVPVMMHLAQCPDCSLRYERLERKLRELAACETERPETFWTRQRLSIVQRINRRPVTVRAPFRIAAAALLAVVLGGVVVYRSTPPSVSQPQAVQDVTVPADPWDSEELKDYGAVVEWESWIEEEKKTL